MTLNDRIESFSETGKILRSSLGGIMTEFTSELELLINEQQLKNPWFTPENVRMSIKSIADELTEENLGNWLSRYPELKHQSNPVKVGVIMAGNIPLAGFHDFLSVLVTGNSILAKTSSKDPDLIKFISKILCNINHEFDERIFFTDGLLKGFDAVIATGSDNTSRYFDYYFGRYPHIIRKNRNSIAILGGNETSEELALLGSDIFTYFGLGCRSISKLYLPKGYNVKNLASNWSGYSGIINNHKYANNYDYNKAVLMVNLEEFIDSGFVILREISPLSSPVAVINFEFYDSYENIFQDISKKSHKIQCIVGRDHTPFGMAQLPRLWDYADGIDTIEFLLKKM